MRPIGSSDHTFSMGNGTLMVNSSPSYVYMCPMSCKNMHKHRVGPASDAEVEPCDGEGASRRSENKPNVALERGFAEDDLVPSIEPERAECCDL